MKGNEVLTRQSRIVHHERRMKKLVYVLVPYTVRDGRLVSPEYDWPEYQRDVASWFADDIESRWQPVTLSGEHGSGIDEVLAAAKHEQRERSVAFFNLCDGGEIDGYPGISIVRALERAWDQDRIPFSGAGSAFYEHSTSKCAHKQLLTQSAVPTAPWMKLENDADLELACSLGFPLIVKPDISSASIGISLRSRVDNRDELRAAWQQLRDSGCKQIFVEPFLQGREATVLIITDPHEPEGLFTLVAERVFSRSLPVNERFLTQQRYSGVLIDEPPPPNDYCNFVSAPELDAELSTLGRRAFRAVNGTGYGRVDMRSDEAGNWYVLEVNANCGLGGDPATYSGQLMALHPSGIKGIITRILAHGETRS